jgi:hypothetical protein
MSTGRTIWMGIDVAWLRRGRNARLRAREGGDGIAVLLSLWLQAKEQRSTDGSVKFSYFSTGESVGVDEGHVRRVLATCVELGVVSYLDDEDEPAECVLRDFAADDKRGGETLDKQDKRAAKKAAGQGGTQRDRGGHVPKSPPRGEESREEQSSSTTSARPSSFAAIDELLTALRRVPQWRRVLDQGGELAVLALVESNPGLPWLDIAGEASASRLDPSPGSIRTDSPVKGLELRMGDHKKGRRLSAVSDETAARHAREEALLRGDAA